MRRFRLVVWLSLALAALAMPIASKAQIISITIAPPELPIYEQPPIPAPGYMWAPGYWAYDPNDGYFWVPGTWILPPAVGLLWTPGYWGWRDGVYGWNEGYWGLHIGFYGGVNYGFGYAGMGYEGGYWNNGVFAYNRTINNFGGVTITNVYEKTVIVNPNATRASFNGGAGGTTAQPAPQEQAAAHEQHVAATSAQTQHVQMASTNKALFVSQNHGQPAIAATAKPGDFNGKGIVAAKEITPSRTLPTSSTGVGTPSTKPTSAATLGTNSTESKGLEKKGPAAKGATLNSGTSTKPSDTKSKSLVAPPPSNTLKPSSPPTTASVKPSPKPPLPPTAPSQAAVKPAPPPPPPPPTPAAVKPAAAKPACPPGKTMTPAGCK